MNSKTRSFYRWAFVMVISLLLGGCGAKFTEIATPDNFLEKKDVSVGLIWVSDNNLLYPSGSEHTAKHQQLGNQGLLDIAINRAFASELSKALGKIYIKDLMNEHYFSVFQPAFEANGFEVKKDEEPYCSETNKSCSNFVEIEDTNLIKVGEGPPWPIATLNYSDALSKLNVDYLLVIHLLRHGTGRTYFSMVPTSPPMGVTAIISYLIDGKTGEIRSQHLASVVEQVQGEWEKAPDYQNLMNAVKASFKIALDEVFIDVFKQAP